MARHKSPTVPLPKERVRELIDDCLDKKGMTRQDMATAIGLRYPKKGQAPKPLSAQTISNQLSANSSDLTMATLSKWCAILEYPVEDLLVGSEYVKPQSLESLRRELDRALRRIDDLEGEVRRIREKAPGTKE